MNLVKFQLKKIFTRRLEYAQHKIICICVESYKIFESNDIEKFTLSSTSINNKKLNINKELVEICYVMDGNFEQDYYSRTAAGSYRIGHGSIRLLEWMAFYDIYYEKLKFFDLLASGLLI